MNDPSVGAAFLVARPVHLAVKYLAVTGSVGSDGIDMDVTDTGAFLWILFQCNVL